MKSMKKVVVCCAINSSVKLRDKILNAWAWKNWNYLHCSGMYEIEGSFIPLDWSKPNIWKIWELELVREHRI